MARPSLLAAGAAFWHTLQFVAKLRLKKGAVSEGHYHIDVRATGTVAGYEIDERIVGTGTQSAPQACASSHGAPQKHVVAWLWQHVPASRRAALRAEALAYFAECHALPGVTEEMEDDAGLWLKQLRATTTETKDGAYTFAPDPDPEDLQAAEERAARLAT